jgi:hypothetical protein
MIRIATPMFLLVDGALRHREKKPFLVQIVQAVLVGSASIFVTQWETQDQKLNDEISADLRKLTNAGFLDALDKIEDLTPTWLFVNLEPASIIISTLISSADSVRETYNKPELVRIRSESSLSLSSPRSIDCQQVVSTPRETPINLGIEDNTSTIIQLIKFASDFSNEFAAHLNFFKLVFGVAQLCTLIQKTDVVWYNAKSKKIDLLKNFHNKLQYHPELILDQHYNCTNVLSKQQQQSNTEMLNAIFHGDCSKIEQTEHTEPCYSAVSFALQTQEGSCNVSGESPKSTEL